MPVAHEHTFPATHALQLVKLVRRWDIPASDILRGTGLTEAELEEPRRRISLELLRRLTRRTRALTAEPGVGIYLGLQKRLTMYGYMGFGAMNASTVGEALELIVRFTPTITTAVGLELDVRGDDASMTFEERVDMEDVHDVAVFSLLVGVRELTSAMTGLSAEHLVFDFPFPEPAYFARFRHILPSARFDQSSPRVHFARTHLDLPLLHPDRAAMLLAVEQCERELGQLGFERQLPARVRMLLLEQDRLRSVDEVATRLHMSTRTLKRRLSAQGVTFSELVTQQRLQIALELLHQPDRTLPEIAHAAGYSSFANFARAFRRWKSESPAQYRRRHQATGT